MIDPTNSVVVSRVPRNQVFTLRQTHKLILDYLRGWDRDYSPMTRDVCAALEKKYSAVEHNLFALDREGYVELVRDDGGRIRNIKLLAVP